MKKQNYNTDIDQMWDTIESITEVTKNISKELSKIKVGHDQFRIESLQEKVDMNSRLSEVEKKLAAVHTELEGEE